MELKSSRSRGPAWLAWLRRPRARTWLALARWGLALALLAVVAVRLDPRLDPRGAPAAAARRVWNSGVAHLTAYPPRLYIDIGYQHYTRLAHKRREALERGLLISSPDDFVPGVIRVGDRRVRVRLRLKGDLSDHWEGEKWSFRVRVRGGDALFGMKQFSLQHPRTRGYLEEWLLHETLRREGLPALRYDFVEVVVNGKYLGVYALEEHFEKRLIENSERRDGPILRFNEDLCWGEFEPGSDVLCEGAGSGSYLAADVDAFHTNDLLADPQGRDLYLEAVQLLEGFRRGALSTGEAFDVPLLARYFAVLELLDRVHASYWRNARFYYNPITARLEPIAFDGGSDGQPPTPGLVPALSAIYDTRNPNNYYYHLYYFDALFRDDDFYRAYIRELERLTAPGYLETLLSELDSELRRVRRILHLEFPGTELDRAHLYRRRDRVRRWLSPVRALEVHLESGASPSGDPQVPGPLVSDAEPVELSVGNLQYLRVEILGLARGDALHPAREGEVVVNARPASRPAAYRPLHFEGFRGEDGGGVPLAELALRYRFLGASATQDAPIFSWPAAGGHEPASALTRMAPNADTFPFATLDEAIREVRLRPGHWTLARDLVVPAGYRLRAGPGTHLDLIGGAMILSAGPVELVGNEESPVIVHSSDGTGQGLAVIGAGGMSLLRYARFAGLSAPARAGWNITGAVTFYEAPVTIEDCEFREARAEDALNLVRSPFVIERSVFGDANSDALDVDFSDGRIATAVFRASGNDALDFSGSVVELVGVRIVGAGDKGISAGERSEVRGRRVRIRDAVVAVASKDLSRVILEDVRVAQARVGFAAYRKKPEFGSGRIQVARLELDAVGRPYAIERGSRMRLDGREVPADRTGVFAEIYGGE